MNIDTKILKILAKFQQTESNSTLDYTSWSIGLYPRDARVLQYMQISQRDTPY